MEDQAPYGNQTANSLNLDHITTLCNLEIEILEHEAFLNVTCSEQPEEALQRGNDLNVLIARTGKMLADAKYWQDGAKVKATENAVSSGLVDRLSPSSFNKYMDYTTKDENFMVNWIERIHRTAEKQLDWTRTLVSYAKEEMRLSH